jgi:hypothetical protein
VYTAEGAQSRPLLEQVSKSSAPVPTVQCLFLPHHFVFRSVLNVDAFHLLQTLDYLDWDFLVPSLDTNRVAS